MKQEHDDINTVSFDMTRHAFVLAVPLGKPAPGVEDGRMAEPVFCINGGSSESLIAALRAIANMIESNGMRNIGKL